jgi:hypothetical protein
VFAMEVASGSSGDVDLSGSKVVLHFELPGDFLSGIDKAKLYVDPAATDDQRREIDAIFHGEKGGLWAGMKEAIKEWLPTQVVPIDIAFGDSPSARVNGIGEVSLQMIKAPDGKIAKLADAPLLAMFAMPQAELAFGHGTKFSDPDLRSWESLGEGSIAHASWSG